MKIVIAIFTCTYKVVNENKDSAIYIQHFTLKEITKSTPISNVGIIFINYFVSVRKYGNNNLHRTEINESEQQVCPKSQMIETESSHVDGLWKVKAEYIVKGNL